MPTDDASDLKDCPVCSGNNKSPRHISSCFLCQYCKTYRQHPSQHYKKCKMVTGYAQDVIRCHICFKNLAKNSVQNHLRVVHKIPIAIGKRPGPLPEKKSSSILQKSAERSKSDRPKGNRTTSPVTSSSTDVSSPEQRTYQLRQPRKRIYSGSLESSTEPNHKRGCPKFVVNLSKLIANNLKI